MENSELIVVIPAYNEEGCLEKVISEWIEGLRTLGPSFQVLVINDGSSDATPNILRNLSDNYPELKYQNQANQGHGAALRNGYDWALEMNPKWIFHVDSDDQFKYADFPKLWESRNQSPAVYGIRSNRNDPFHRIIISRILRLIIFISFGVWIPDANVPYRLLSKEFLESSLKNIPKDFFAPNIFISLFAFSFRGKIPVYPVSHIERQTGQISLPSSRLIKACLKSFWELIKFRLKFRSSLKSIEWRTEFV